MRRFVVSNIFLWLFWSNNFCNTDFKIVVWRLLLLLGQSKYQLTAKGDLVTFNQMTECRWNFFFFWLCFSLSICMPKNRACSCLLFHWSISWQLLCNKSWKYLSGPSWTKDDLLLPIWPSHQALIRCKWQISKWTCHWL